MRRTALARSPGVEQALGGCNPEAGNGTLDGSGDRPGVDIGEKAGRASGIGMDNKPDRKGLGRLVERIVSASGEGNAGPFPVVEIFAVVVPLELLELVLHAVDEGFPDPEAPECRRRWQRPGDRCGSFPRCRSGPEGRRFQYPAAPTNPARFKGHELRHGLSGLEGEIPRAVKGGIAVGLGILVEHPLQEGNGTGL